LREIISVIIPTLNEASTLENSLKSVGTRFDCEKIVVDGGSYDSTADIARNYNCTVLVTESSRARQMNMGAMNASGEILLFLHADTTLPDKWSDAVWEILREDGVVCGAFTLSISGNLRGLYLIELVSNFRSRVLNTPYGDQAFFMTKQAFTMIGGFPDQPIMEDFEFIRRLGKKGKIRISALSVNTSDRRWKKLGLLRTTLINQIVIAAYYLGFSTNKLRKLYDKWA
jgi:uncharacterized protein